MDNFCLPKLIILCLVVYYTGFVRSPFLQTYTPGFISATKANNFVKWHRDRINIIRRRDVNEENSGQCTLHGSCEANKETGIIPICYCDEICSLYNDCCHDSKQLNRTNDSTEKENIEYITCETKTLNTRFKDVFGLFLVSKCPPPVEEYLYRNISKLCQTTVAFPVTSENGVTFKNEHCALCHDVQKYFIWTLAMYFSGPDCSFEKISNLNLTHLEKINYIRRNCDSWFFPPKSATFRFCVKDMFNVTKENNLCSKFQNPVSFKWPNTLNKKYYRNAHCMKYKTGDFISCLSPQPYVTIDNKVHGNVALTGLFYTRPNDRGSGGDCQTSTLKQSLLNECCDQSQEFCVEELVKNYKYKIKQNFVTNGDIDSTTFTRILVFVYMSLPVDKYDLYLNYIYNSNGYWCSNYTQEQCCVYEAVISITINKARTYKQIVSFITDTLNMEWSVSEIHIEKVYHINKVENISLYCPKAQSIAYNNFFLLSEDQLRKSIEILERFRASSDDVPVSVNGTISVIDRVKFDFVVVNWEATYRGSNNTSFNNTTATLNTVWGLKSILTYLTLGLSCLSLLVTMLVYQYLGLFQSNAGKISRHMMISLFSAELVFITVVGANYIYEICLAIAVLSHYLWLCTFSWMSVFCVQVLQKIWKMKNSSGSLVFRNKLASRYIFFGYILPVCFILPCALLDIFTDIPIDYTGEICFISGFPANLIAFTVPVLISILTNIIALITTSVLVSRYNDTIKSLHTLTITRSFIPLYFRSCILCAFPWIFGILADMFYSEILEYVYILLAGSHGIFLSISFISTKNVTNKVRQLFRKNNKP